MTTQAHPFDSNTVRNAVQAADAHREDGDPFIAGLVDHIDALVRELRGITQAHADSLEAYSSLRRRVRDATEVDDYS